MKVWNRSQGKYIEEQEYQKALLDFLYGTAPGRILLKTIAVKPWFSRLCSYGRRSRASVKKIAPFVKKYQIDLSECERTDFQSFDDFFTRKRSYQCTAKDTDMIAVADARLAAYPISEELVLRVKRSSYTLEELVGEAAAADFSLENYRGGLCLVYRLAVEDYHRYVFGDEGSLEWSAKIPGVLHTVRPVSERFRVYSRNHRVCSLLHTRHFGDILQIEVGALLIGKIHNHKVKKFVRLQEKGYFQYGGSTIIQLIEPGRASLAKDIAEMSGKGVECLVHIGEVIGNAYQKGENDA